MTRTVYYAASTLDGFLADEHDCLDWLLHQDIDAEGPGGNDAFMRSVGSIVMGRATYMWLREHLEADGDGWPYTVPAWVLSHAELPGIEGADLRFASGPVVPLHAELVAAAGAKDVWVVGGGDLAGQFVDAGLLDQLIIAITPVTLGAGKPLLPRRLDLTLRTVARNRAFVCATFDVLGPMR